MTCLYLSGLERAAQIADDYAAAFENLADFYQPPRVACDPYLEDIHRQAAAGIAQVADAIRREMAREQNGTGT